MDFIHVLRNNQDSYIFYANGAYYQDEDCECLLFPSKDKRNWNGWQHELFKPGDIITYDKGYLRMVKVLGNFKGVDAYGIERDGLLFSNWRYATEEEKEMFYKIFDSYYKDDDGGTVSGEIKEIRVKDAIKKDSKIVLPVTKEGNDFDRDTIANKIYSKLDDIFCKLSELKELHNDFTDVVNLLNKLPDE